jgi:pimeloyl-ACP methyl ester carboxylesterase
VPGFHRQNAGVELAEPDRATFVEVNRTSLRCWEWGDPDAPAIVFTHGAFDHGRLFDELAPRVAELGYHAVAVDLRGHGDSGRLGTGHAWWPVVLDLALLARHLGAPVGLIGHSMGAGQAMTMAAAFPELARFVVSLDGLGPPADAFAERDMREGAVKALGSIERLQTSPPRAYATVEEMAERRRAVNTRLTEDWALHLARHGSRLTEGGYVWKADPVFGVGLPNAFDIDLLDAELSGVACPLLVLMGTEPDMWSDLPHDERERRISMFADARLIEVAGAGHYVHLEQPDVVVGHIASFLAEVES